MHITEVIMCCCTVAFVQTHLVETKQYTPTARGLVGQWFSCPSYLLLVRLSRYVKEYKWQLG